jgi:hypothetical protein
MRNQPVKQTDLTQSFSPNSACPCILDSPCPCISDSACSHGLEQRLKASYAEPALKMCPPIPAGLQNSDCPRILDIRDTAALPNQQATLSETRPRRKQTCLLHLNRSESNSEIADNRADARGSMLCSLMANILSSSNCCSTFASLLRRRKFSLLKRCFCLRIKAISASLDN